MTHFTHTGTDQNWKDETTIYWFEATQDAVDASHGEIEIGDEFGVADTNGETTILDADGVPADGIAPAIRAVLDKHLIRAYEAVDKSA